MTQSASSGNVFVNFRIFHIDFGPSLLSNSPSRALAAKEARKGFKEPLDRTSGMVDVSRKTVLSDTVKTRALVAASAIRKGLVDALKTL